MPFTEFCCRSGGSNLNAGTRRGDSTVPGISPDVIYANGSWDGTSVYTVASGNPITDGVAVGDYASVYATGNTMADIIGLVSARTSTTITIAAKSGALASGTGTRGLRIGGAWAGPSGANPFPLSRITSGASSGRPIRVNLKNDQTYTMTANITVPAVVSLAGFGAAYGDGGRTDISSNTTTESITHNGGVLSDLIVTQTAVSGAPSCVLTSTGNPVIQGVAVKGARGAGIQTSAPTAVIECEAYDCNKAGGTAAGFLVTAQSRLIRCVAHGASVGGQLAIGFLIYTGGGGTLLNCVAFDNAGIGFYLASTLAVSMIGCDAYDNGDSGVYAGSTVTTLIESCNFIKNGAYGVNAPGGLGACFLVSNCGFGSGLMANTSGATNNSPYMIEQDSTTYPSGLTPWADPDNGDFRIVLAEARGTGRGAFTETQNSKSGTIAYPDIGAAQHLDAGGGGFVFGG